MDRRTFAATLGVWLIAATGSARSQGRSATRIGYIAAWYNRVAAHSLFDAFRQGMRELGYVEGQNLTIDARWLDVVSSDQVAILTTELVRSKVDVVVAHGASVPGVKAASGSTPVVFGYSGDPVAAGLVTSLSRPGGNLTGMTILDAELAGKRVEFLTEAAPRVSRVAVLWTPLHVGEDEVSRNTEIAARRMGLPIRQFPVRTAAEVDAALETMARDKVDGVVALSNSLIMNHRSAIAEFSLKHRIATISGWEDFALDGNLMTYGPDLQQVWQQLATYVDKILKGARPPDLPVEQPTKFQLVINLKAAKGLGLTIPPPLLLRADRVVR